MIKQEDKILNKTPFTGEDGLQYLHVTKEVWIPRKTFLRGTITGKYRGERLTNEKLYNTDLFDFVIYEAEVICELEKDIFGENDFRKNRPFNYPEDFKTKGKNIKDIRIFPKEKLPNILAVNIISHGKSLGVNINEPQIFDFEPIRKMHQTTGDQVFGMFNAFITGYIIDYEPEIIKEIIGPIIGKGGDDDDEPEEGPISKPCVSNGIPTGETRKKGNYLEREYHCVNHDDTVWKSEYIGGIIPPLNPPGENIFSSCLSFLGFLIGLICLFAILPQLLILLPFILLPWILSLLEPYFVWIFRVLGVLLLIGFIYAITSNWNNQGSTSFNPKPVIVDTPEEVKENIKPIYDTINRKEIKDTIIKRFRSWKDYEGNSYEGYYTIKKSALVKATNFKHSLNFSMNTMASYDKIIYSLKENDKKELNGLYKLFDSIQSEKNLNKLKFAEMVTTFVQDIPYALILESDCDAKLYNDKFINTYLASPNAICQGYQRFGINTPLEFLVSLKGDCDTRTLLLYTILSKYNYDVSLLSSEQYGHSILGINLPYNGLAYDYFGQRYVLWETTAPDIRPGIINNEISNLNNWRISLKSK